jgi:hypothetical protein
MSIAYYIDLIRSELLDSELNESFVNHQCDKASYEISNKINIVLDEVRESCDQISVRSNGTVTLNVQETDYGYEVVATPNSEVEIPEKQMLPHLLKNAKVAKDGSRYKVIPIGKKSNSVIDTYRQGFKSSNVSPGKQEFRVASSKQNANSQWVIPARTMDFSQDVDALNSYLQEKIDSIISEQLDNIRKFLF